MTTDYGFILTDGQRVIPTSETPYFYWVGHTYNIGSFQNFEMAVEYMERLPKGIWLTDDYGSAPKNSGRYIPFETIKSVFRI